MAPLGSATIADSASHWISRRSLAPVDQITQTARSISVQNLSGRLVVPQTGDELQRLSETLNNMLGRLEAAFKKIIQFTADASHERTHTGTTPRALHPPSIGLAGLGQLTLIAGNTQYSYSPRFANLKDFVRGDYKATRGAITPFAPDRSATTPTTLIGCGGV